MFNTELYSAAQVRELDRIAIEQFDVSSYELMLRAGRFSYETLKKTYPDEYYINVICGCGNNAGDGYVLAKLAIEDEKSVTLLNFHFIYCLMYLTNCSISVLDRVACEPPILMSLSQTKNGAHIINVFHLLCYVFICLYICVLTCFTCMSRSFAELTALFIKGNKNKLPYQSLI